MMDFGTCACTGKGMAKLVQPASLITLLQGEHHAYEVLQRLGELPLYGEGLPNTAGVYRVLNGMEKQGLVTSRWVPSDAGPPKRLYRITDDGVACAHRWVRTLREYSFALQRLAASSEHALQEWGRGEGETGPCEPPAPELRPEGACLCCQPSMQGPEGVPRLGEEG